METEGKTESPFPAWLVGSWCSIRANIIGYVPGRETLIWTTQGEETWTIEREPGVECSVVNFQCVFRDGVLRRWHQKSGREYVALHISGVGENLIEVGHPADKPIHLTVYRRTSDR
jgi:hypothetical protein